MPYITCVRAQRTHQLSFDDIMNGLDSSSFVQDKYTWDTTTWCPEVISRKVLDKFNYSRMYSSIREFNEKYADLISADKASLYSSFKIPKRSGGLRQIDQPNARLMCALRELKQILEKEFGFTYHTSAFAYVRHRSTIDAVKRHQANNSRWLLKTDLSKFFPSTNQEFLLKMLYQTFPLCEFSRVDLYRKAFEEAISLCFLNGGLPQGTPISPMLTNQMMIPVDYTISKMCHEYSPHICYTRYADDMDFSSEYSFHWTDIVNKVSKILESFGAPFTFNKEKIHYGSSAGRNWILGVMLNKDNNITIGHARKKNFKVLLFSFGNSIKDGKPWNLEDAQHLQGLISYFKMVEGNEEIDRIVSNYSEKFGFNLYDKLKAIIKGDL